MVEHEYNEQQVERLDYEHLFEELAALQKELQKDKTSPTLVEFAKERIAELPQHREIVAEAMSELNLLFEEIVRNLISVENSEKKRLQDEMTTVKKRLSPEIVTLLGDVREKAYVYLADKKRGEIAGEMVETVQGWTNEFASQTGIIPSVLRRAGRVLGGKLDV